MNFLAHAILTPAGCPKRLVGNLTADWVKGRARRTLEPEVQAGFLLHRHIDVFTDTHPLVAACAARLSERWGRYAAILTDILFDHSLSLAWGEYSGEPRGDFIARTYGVLREHLELLPEETHFPIYAMIADDWLSTYATLDGIRLTLTRVSARLQMRGHAIELAPAAEDFVRCEGAFAAAFARFFPELQRHVATLEVAQAA